MSDESSCSMAKLRCDVCGKRFKKGGTRYRVSLEIVSDFDGYIDDFSKKPEDHLEKKIEEILEETQEMSEQELEEEIYLKRNWLVCVNCRERFLTILKQLCE
jgi:hypothetical protein